MLPNDFAFTDLCGIFETVNIVVLAFFIDIFAGLLIVDSFYLFSRQVSFTIIGLQLALYLYANIEITGFRATCMSLFTER